MSEELKKQILEVLSQHPLCVLSTVTSAGSPQAAIVGFAQNADLQLLIGTSSQTRKYANLQQNQKVAVVVGDFKAEVQYEGIAQQVMKSDVAELETRFEKLPGTARYLEDETQAWFTISPTWIRLTVHGAENRVEEVNFP